MCYKLERVQEGCILKEERVNALQRRKTMEDAHQQPCDMWQWQLNVCTFPRLQVPPTEALFYACSSVDIRPARNATYLPCTSFLVNRRESAGRLDFPCLPPSLHLCPQVPVYRCLERTGWGQKGSMLAMSWFLIYFCCAAPWSCVASETTWLTGGIPAHEVATSGVEGLKKAEQVGQARSPLSFTLRMSSSVSPILRRNVHTRRGHSQCGCRFLGKEKDLVIVSTESSRHRSWLLLALGTGLLWLKTMEFCVLPFPKELIKSDYWKWETGGQHHLRWHQHDLAQAALY